MLLQRRGTSAWSRRRRRDCKAARGRDTEIGGKLVEDLAPGTGQRRLSHLRVPGCELCPATDRASGSVIRRLPGSFKHDVLTEPQSSKRERSCIGVMSSGVPIEDALAFSGNALDQARQHLPAPTRGTTVTPCSRHESTDSRQRTVLSLAGPTTYDAAGSLIGSASVATNGTLGCATGDLGERLRHGVRRRLHSAQWKRGGYRQHTLA